MWGCYSLKINKSDPPLDGYGFDIDIPPPSSVDGTALYFFLLNHLITYLAFFSFNTPRKRNWNNYNIVSIIIVLYLIAIGQL
jgi:hypothetical protein